MPERGYSQDYKEFFDIWSQRSPEEWAEKTKNWNEGFKELARILKRQPSEKRFEGAWKLYMLSTQEADENERTLLQFSSMIGNLTDEQLDIVINSFLKE